MRLLFVAALLAAGMPAEAGVFGEPDLLQPGAAFQLSARALDPRTVELRFGIAEGYYLYRERFRFASASGEPLHGEIPRGEVKEDPYFGRTEILRHEVRIRIPMASSGTGRSVDLDVTSQGCADQGVCFLPQKQRVHVALPGTGE